MTTTKNWADWYASNGWIPIPIRHKSKEPLENSWTSTTLETAINTLDSRFPENEPRNIGVLLGPASAGLTDIDLDCAEARDIAENFLPDTLTFGRASAPRSHWLYQCDGIPYFKFTDPLAKDGEKSVLLEIRSANRKGKTAFQTVMPPSVHTSGENIEFTAGQPDDKLPAPIEILPLQRACHLLASACLLARYWPQQGTRHDSAKALAGMFAHGGCSLDEALYLILSGAIWANDDEADDREQCVRDTFAKFENGEEVTGAPTLIEYGWNEEIVKRLKAWACAKLRVDMNSAAFTANADIGHPLTDAGNGVRFANRHAHHARFVVEWKKWIVWTGTHWAQDQIQVRRMSLDTAKSIFEEANAASDKQTAAALRAWGRQTLSNTGLYNILKAAEFLPGIPIHAEELDKDRNLIACPNGTVDLRTRELKEPDANDFLTRLCQTPYNKDATAPLWCKTVSEVMNNDQELTEFFQLAVGYAFSGACTEQGLFICYGVGANGKSTVLNTLQNVLGEQHVCNVPSEILLLKQGQSHPTGLTIMHGKRLALSVEPEMNRTLAEGLIKSLTGGDKISARRMGEDFWEYMPTHTIFLLTNHKPAIRGTDNGIWRRIWPIPFNVVFQNPDKLLMEKLKAEYEGILAWLVDGASAYLNVPEAFELPKACQEFKDAYRSEEDRLGNFIDDCIERDANSREIQTKIWSIYQMWCADQSEETVGKQSFNKMMDERGFPQVKSNSKRYRVGMKLKGPHTEAWERQNNKAPGAPRVSLVR